MPATRSALIWCVVAFMGALTAASFALAGLRVDASHNLSFFAFLGILFALNAFYRFVRPDQHLRTATETTVQLLLVLLFGILLTYSAVAADYPFADPTFYGVDQAIGFSRQSYEAFFGAHPVLDDVIRVAYFTLLPQFLVVSAALIVARHVPRLHHFIVAVAIALLITVAISMVVPSVTAFVYVDLAHAHLANVAHLPAGIYTPMPTLAGLRDGSMTTVHLNNLEALVGFPSFHTAGALLFVWAMWPLRRLRWAVVALNIALIADTPLDGGHYAIDVVAGVVVMLVSVALADRLCAWAERREPVMPILRVPKQERAGLRARP